MKLLYTVLVLVCWFFELVELTKNPYLCSTPVIKNGKFRYRRRGKFVKYSCNVGFVLFGEKYNNCIHGKWDGPPPKCVRPGCKKVNSPYNGLIFPTFSGAVLHFFCKPGYELHGPERTHCNGTAWSDNMPICLSSNTKPPLSCDFESQDLCGWTHDLNHDFDWRRMQYSTPSGAIGTGPSFDHTKGSNYYPEDPFLAGHYMYIESSSKNENDRARLISPVYEKTPNKTCFVFFYHMYGSTIGTLRIYLKLVNDTRDLVPQKAFFQEHGNQGDRWIRGIHLFDGISSDYQIIIEGVRGSGYVSDIAIDDVSIVNNCNLEDFQDTEISTTTELEEYSTTDYLPDDLYSCEGRCYSTIIPVGNHRTCSCDENCYDRDECCPDYIDFCLIHETTTLNEESDTPIDTTVAITPSTAPSTRRTTSTTTSTTTSSTTTTSTTSTTTPRPTTKTRKVTATTPIAVTTTQWTTPKEQTTPKPQITTKETKIETTTEDEEIDDITDDININPAWVTDDMPDEIPLFPKNIAPIEDVAHLTKNSDEKIVVFKYAEKRSYMLFYVIGLGFVVAGLIFFVVRRKKGRKSRRFRSGSQGGSASDVRFLTSDELLDLNLDYE